MNDVGNIVRRKRVDILQKLDFTLLIIFSPPRGKKAGIYKIRVAIERMR